MRMVSAKLLLILSQLALSIDAAKWKSRFNVFTVGLNQDAFMECEVSGENVTFMGFYRKNGSKIEESERIRIKNDTDNNAYTLDIIQVTEEDYDIYTCKDSSGSDELTLEIAVSMGPVESPQILVVGDPGILKVRVYSNPKHKMEWTLVQGDPPTSTKIASVASSGDMLIGAGMYKIDRTGSLHIFKVTAEHAGEYTITVNAHGSRVKGSLTAKVEYKLELKTKPEETYIRAVGQELFIPCEWLYADRKLPTWTFTSKGVIVEIHDGISPTGLNLTSVTMESQGTYTCGASNKYGNQTISASLIQVIDPAKIITDMKDLKKELGSSYELVCEASGTPIPTLKLSKITQSFHEIIDNGSGKVRKVFPKLSINDGGIYSCYADNGATTVSGVSLAETRNITLEVFASSKIDKSVTTKSIISAVGLNFFITCSARGSPYPKVELLSGGKDVASTVITKDHIVTAKLIVKKAVQQNFAFSEILCKATNAYGEDSVKIPITQIVKAPGPQNLIGTTGLDYIDLRWNSVSTADSYLVYLNGSLNQRTVAPKTSIKTLQHSTYYSVTVASDNLAGVGQPSDQLVVVTADIVRPNSVWNIRVADLTSRSASIHWNSPNNVDMNLVTYRTEFCPVINDTVVSEKCVESKEKKESRLYLTNLSEGTEYEIKVIAVNQGKQGDTAPFRFTTKEVPVTSRPVTNGKGPGGLTSGEIAGIIVAIILILLIVVDMFCCYFNHCGFTHCCFETFCAEKDKKFLPVGENDEEAPELEPKLEHAV